MRRILLRTDDVLKIGQYEVEAEVLTSIVNPNNRLLWAFIEKDGRIQAVPYSEEQVLWMQESDLSKEEDLRQL